LSYAYSAGGRTRVTTKDAHGSEFHTLDVFGTLRLVDTKYGTATTDDYRVAPENAVGLVGGVARVFYDRGVVLPMAGVTPLHVFFDLDDYMGSSTFVIDKDSGEIVERTTYQAYGALESDYRPDRWGAGREAFKFSGKEEDIEVGATYFGARYYNARLGRWMSADPLEIHGLGGDTNPYAYVGGHVLSSVDPFGLGEATPGEAPIIEDTVIVHGPPRGSAARSAELADQKAERGEAAAEGAQGLVVGIPLPSVIKVATGNVRIPIGCGNYVRPKGIAIVGQNAVKGAVIGALDPAGYRFLLNLAGYNVEHAVMRSAGDGPKDRSAIVGTGFLVAGAVVTGKVLAPSAVEGVVGAGETVTLYHGHQAPLVGGAFDLDVAVGLQGATTPEAGVYLTNDLVRAATQYAGPSGFVTRTQISASAAEEMMQASPIRGPRGAVQYEWVARSPEQVDLLNQSIQTLPQIQALRLWLGIP
jgi:RHS repeat-associated protein